MRFSFITFIILLISACTTVPEQIQGTFSDVSPARVDAAAYGTDIRWGGLILATRNTGEKTCFEVLSRNLDKYLRPELEDVTAGRFIACKKGFHDPAVFRVGREITLTGTVTETQSRKLEGIDYRYPIVEVDDLVLWQKRRTVMVVNHHHSPFMGPYWGYSRWGWGGGWGYPGYWGGYWPSHYSSYAYPKVLLPDPSIIESTDDR